MSELPYQRIKERLNEIDNLLEVEDPEDEPYKSRYAAREILELLKKKLNDYVDSCRPTETGEGGDQDDQSSLSIDRIQLEFSGDTILVERHKAELFLMYIESRLGANYIECEETSSGEEHLNNALAALKNRFPNSASHTVMLNMILLNQLGILHATRRQNEKAVAVLRKADNFYEVYKREQSDAPLSPTDLLAAQSGGTVVKL